MKKLERDQDSGYLGGVCSGIANSTDTSAIGWRFLFIFALGPVAYIAAWLIIKHKI